METSAGSIFGVLAVLITTCGVIVTALINRSTRQSAASAARHADPLELLADALARVDAIEEREQDCLNALEWAHMRISVLEQMAGIDASPPPHPLRHKRRRPRA